MNHTSEVHFRFSRPFAVLGLLMLVGANGDAGKTWATRPETLGSLLQQMRGTPSQPKPSDIGKAALPVPLFLEAPQYPTGIFPQSIVVADFNGDGKDDFAVANFCSDDACSQSSISI